MLAMDKGRDHVGDRLASPLGRHVANTLDGDELEAVVLLGVTRHLAVGVPWSPCVDNGPAEGSLPHLGTVGGNCTIGVARVEHEVSLALEHAIDPLGGLILNVIVESLRALLPGLNLRWDVESCTHILTVHVVGKEAAIDGVGLISEVHCCERCVLSHGHSTLVGACLTINNSFTHAFRRSEGKVVVVSVQVVPV